MKWTRALHSGPNIIVPFALCFLCQQATVLSANSNHSRFFQWYRWLAAHISACRRSRWKLLRHPGYGGAHGFDTRWHIHQLT
jgi:hypothetical protein